MKGSNGRVSYSTDDGKTFLGRQLWVNGVTQPLALSVSKHQSRRASYVYPRSFAPGDITVSGICESQKDYQELALFLRVHQTALLDTPASDRFARLTSGNTAGTKRLLKLSVPSEGLLVRGWVTSFSARYRGVFEFAPEYSFNLFVVFDHMSENIGISNQMREFWQNDPTVPTTVISVASPTSPETDEDIVSDPGPPPDIDT